MSKAERETVYIPKSQLDDLPHYSYYDKAAQEAKIAASKPKMQFSRTERFHSLTNANLKPSVGTYTISNGDVQVSEG